LDKFQVPNKTERHLAALRRQAGKLQSEEVSATDKPVAENVTAQNIVFKDEALSQRINLGDMSGGNYDADADSTAGLGDYLSRPVRIATLNWLENTFTQTAILPWHLYFDTPQIKKKLDNYGKISCRLHLKFVLNASPFYYGSLRACYFPLSDARSTYVSSADQVPFSQAPGVYLEPQNMSTAEMVLPFLWTRNWLEATAANDFRQMGVLQFLQYANLRSANGVAGTGITVAVYAWAEDVEVMGPTTVGAMQSEEHGTVSGPATAVAEMADHLADAPIIGDFATATSVGARAVASIAKLFGYSNPPLIDDVKPMQPKTFHAFANVETRMPVDKLCVDPKNEVTISSKVAGVDEEDPLAFSGLLTRESFLMGSLWSNSQAPDTLLWSALVHPSPCVSSGGFFTTPPVAHFSRMARLWRGSLVYKFRFIKTKYHKGRVLISWDPNGDISATADTETTTFSRVVDLAVEDEVEVVVPYRATAPWLNTREITTTTQSNGTTPSYVYDSELYNGSITMRVQNLLTGPAASPQIDVLVYVKAGDDFMLSVPTEISTLYSTRDPTGVIQSEEESISQDKPTVDKHVSLITTGELISSVRPLLHRASLAYVQPAGVPSVGQTQAFIRTANHYPRVPVGVGRDPLGFGYATVAGAGVRYNFTPNHPIDWTINCYVGYRGSVTVHVNTSGVGSNVTNVSHLAINRMYQSPNLSLSLFPNSEQVTDVPTAPNALSRSSIRYPTAPRTVVPTGQTGMTLTNVQGQPACSANIPQYNRFRFHPAFQGVRNMDPKNSVTYHDGFTVSTGFNSNATTTATSDWPTLAVYYAAGVDFQPIFFLCTPRLFTTSLPVARDIYP
jgi:hypothetical protein